MQLRKLGQEAEGQITRLLLGAEQQEGMWRLE